jgi:hypothetical protein
MEGQTMGRRTFKSIILGGLVGLVLGGAVISLPAAPVAASAQPRLMAIEAPVAPSDEQFVVGFYGTGGNIVDLHQLIGEPFEQVVQRNAGARWEFGYDGSFRFVPADGGPAMMGFWQIREKQEVIEFEASAGADTEQGRLDVATRGRINLKDSTARVEQARRLIHDGDALVSYTEFTIILY